MKPKNKFFATIFVPAILLVLSAGAQTPNPIPAAYSASTVNYTRMWVPTAPEQNSANLLVRPPGDVKQLTNYVDGFGRPLQSVAKDASPAGNDLVTPHVYDPTTGKEIYAYLPFVANVATAGDITNDGNFKKDAFQQQASFYNTYLSGQQNETNVGTGGSNWAYSQTTYEASPLDRPLANYAPGNGWVGSQASSTPHSTQLEYVVNTPTDNVRMWTMAAWSVSSPESQGTIIPTDAGPYPAGALYKTIATDEQGLQTVEFRDQYGQVILRKQQLQSSSAPYTPFDDGTGSDYTGWVCTYYVYDDHGYLRFIITPNLVAQMAIAGNWSISLGQADELCYRFEYDQRGQLIIRKTPGTLSGSQGEVWMVYDERHRLVMQQDGDMRANKQWVYIQYDNLDRPIAQGLLNDPANYSNLSYHVNGAATSGNNSSGVSAWPALSSYTTELLSQIFYDNYNGIPSTLPKTLDATGNGAGNSAFTTAYNTTPVYAQPIAQSSMTQGMVTGTNTEVLGTAGGQYIPMVRFYDEKGRAIQTQSVNLTRGKDIGTVQYDWSGKPLSTVMYQNYSSTANPQTHIITSAISYDVMGRATAISKTVSSNVNGVAVSSPKTTTSAATYDELSRLFKKTLGNNLETLTYGYNVRGWLLGVNRGFISGTASNYFGLELGYDETVSASGNAYLTPRFNGNIAGTVWKTKGDGINRKYDLSYDNLGRLTAAAFLQNSTGSTWDKSFLDFSVSGIGYDGNGNMTAMEQNGFVQGGSKPIDQLVYNYLLGPGNSNRLQYVNDNVNVTNSTLGDFHFTGSAKTTSSVDYGYDANANITSDANRSISSIAYYTYPNLPNVITTPKGTIHYIYDAAGDKLEKQVVENGLTVNGTATSLTTDTYYVDGAIYKTVAYSAGALASLNSTDVLQFIGTEDGRLRFKPAVGAVPAQFVHDYLIRDHLGHVRVGLTDEAQQDVYPAATGETTSVTVSGVAGTAQNYESQYYSFNPNDFVNATSLGSWFTAMSGSGYDNQNSQAANNDPYSQTTATSAKVFQLSGNTVNNPSGDRFGCGITLKVMAGDVINIYGSSFWHNTGNLPAGRYPVSAVLGSLLGAFGGSAAVTSTLSHSVLDGGAFSTATTTPTATALAPLLSSDTNQTGTQAPYAGINYIVFDDQFRPQGSVGFDAVSATTDNIKPHSLTVSISRDGYIFVYVSNQSAINVYFDNLQVVHTRGPMLEETHYYPTGVAMAGISDRAWNKQPNYFHYQGKELQDEEWHDGSGLEEYDFQARYYDPQLGRWTAQDPASQYATPYSGMGNNWMNSVDPDGKNVWSALGTVGIIVGSAALAYFTDGFGLVAEHSVLAAALVGAGAYLGASWAVGDYNPTKWTSRALEGAAIGAVAGAAAFVGGEELFGADYPVMIHNGAYVHVEIVDAASHAYGAGMGSIVENASVSVLSKLATTETSALITTGKDMTLRQAMAATTTGLIMGALNGWNPVKPLMEEDGTYFTGLGLNASTAAGASLGQFAQGSLYKMVTSAGGSILSNLLNCKNTYANVSLPVPLGVGAPALNFTIDGAQMLSVGSQSGLITGLVNSETNNLFGPFAPTVGNLIFQLLFDKWHR